MLDLVTLTTRTAAEPCRPVPAPRTRSLLGLALAGALLASPASAQQPTVSITDVWMHFENHTAISFVPGTPTEGMGGPACAGLLMVSGPLGPRMLDPLNLAAGAIELGPSGPHVCVGSALATFISGAQDAATTASGGVYRLAGGGDITRFGMFFNQNTGLERVQGLAIVERVPQPITGGGELYAVVSGYINNDTSRPALRIQNLSTGYTVAEVRTPFLFSGLAALGRIDGEEQFVGVRNEAAGAVYQFSLGASLNAPAYRHVHTFPIVEGLGGSLTALAYLNQRIYVLNGDDLGSGPFTPFSRRLCPADFNADGTLDPDDLADFIACYFATPLCAEADFNGDTNTDPDDLSDFISAYFAGC